MTDSIIMEKTIAKRLLGNIDPSFHEVFEPLLISDGFYAILKTIDAQIREKKEIYPAIKNIFLPFNIGNFHEMKVIILGQDPYPQKDVATGIAYANKPEQETLSPSLRIIVEELTESINDFNEFEFFEKSDLIHWVEQGIYPLNTSFTVLQKQPNSHRELWRRFTRALLYRIIWLSRNKLMIVPTGKTAQDSFKEVEQLLEEKNINASYNVAKVPHPAADTYGNYRRFRGSGIFVNIKDYVKRNYGQDIKYS